MGWLNIAKAAAPIVGGIAGSLIGGKKGNIDKSPGLQETYKDLLRGPAQGLLEQQLGQVAGMDLGTSPMTTEGLGMIRESIGGMQPMIDQAQQAYTTGLGAIDVANNPYVQDMLDQQRDQAGRLFNEQINPALRRGSIAGGMYGGGRSPVSQGIAAGKVSEALADQQARTQLGAYSQGLGALTSLVPQAANISSLGALPGTTLAGAGGMDEAARRAAAQSELATPWVPIQNWANLESSRFGAHPIPQIPGTSGLAAGVGYGSLLSGMLGNIWKPEGTPGGAGGGAPTGAGFNTYDTNFGLNFFGNS